MLLPTGYYVAGGVLAVAASFLLLTRVPCKWLRYAEDHSIALFRVPNVGPFWPSLVSFVFLCLLLFAGFHGETDPLANPLVLWVWVLWWIGFTALQCLTGTLWTVLNPWSGPVELLRNLTGKRKPLLQLPAAIGFLPAIVVFFGFAWFELIYPAPDDPARLASVVLTYWCFVFVCILLFGEGIWFSRGEPFFIFFRLIGACSPLVRETEEAAGSRSTTQIRLAWPGISFLRMPPLPMSGILLVLLTLSSVSFDGLSGTFAWLSFIAVNPLEYPGRSAVTGSNTLGLLSAFLVLSGLFLFSVYAGCRLVGRQDVFVKASGQLVYSIIPISLVFHIAHYLTLFLTNVQYAALASSDPFGQDWDILGLHHFHVTTSFLNDIDSVAFIWASQTVIIVSGHIMGIVIAHMLATRLFGSVTEATRSQIFLAGLMILYTVFGLWLLSTASIG